MPPSAPFSVGSAQPLPYPALYLYPLNDSFVPKHIALSHGQHVKIGRQTNAKTAPGERNGYFDSKVLSRQHAEVWEDAGKIFIKDVKSSNGTFINGERLSSEAVESDPYELKSDDIVEFGIDIVGEDNKTIIHHKVAARVICVFTEQDAQVAARAEQHQHQQQLQYQHQQQAAQQSQQQHGAHGHPNGVMGGAAGMMPPGPSAAQSGFNFSGALGVGGASAGLGVGAVGASQRRQMAQQPSLGGMGGMGGGMRPPGKSGLTFDVILSRLQGELQKSRETGAELNTLTGALGEVHESLSGGLPANIPAFPSTLPPVRPAAQEPPGASGSPHQTSPPTSSSPPPAASVPPAVIAELQLQLRDTQSTLATQLEKIRALEAVLSEQEVVKSEVRTLREIVEERTREIDGGSSRKRHAEGAGHPSLGGRGGFDLEEDEDRAQEEESDNDDDARSVMTVMPHELESVEEEDEEGAADQDERDARDANDQTRESEDLSEQDEEGKQQLEDERIEERGRKSLNLCVDDAGAEFERPRTPEPFATSTFSEVKSKAVPHPTSAIPSPTKTTAAAPSGSSTHDEIQAQIAQLTAQVTAVMQLTGTLEAQHSAAQSTIRALETKVGVLEGLLKAGINSTITTPATPPPSEAPDKSLETGVAKEVEGGEETTTLTSRIAEWMKSVDGQWSSVQDEWGLERERLNRAREEWEAKVKLVEGGLERVERVANAAAASATAASAAAAAAAAASNHGNGHSISSRRMNGDAVKHRGGLVTPPSPRSQSSGSESGRYQGRRRRRRGGHGRRHSSSASESLSESDEDEVGSGSGSRSASPSTRAARQGGSVDDAYLEFDHSEASVGGESKEGSLAGSVLESARARARTLATPEPSVYKASSPASEVALAILEHGKEEAEAGKAHARDMGRGKEGLNGNTINVQTAVGVLLLSVAAAAVIWKVKPE